MNGIYDAVTSKENQEFVVGAALNSLIGVGIAELAVQGGFYLAKTTVRAGWEGHFKLALATAAFASFLIRGYADRAETLSENQADQIKFASAFVTLTPALLYLSNPTSYRTAFLAPFILGIGHGFASNISRALVTLFRAPFIDEIEEDDDEVFIPTETNSAPQSSPFQVTNPEKISVSFRDVAGIDNAKEEVQEVVDFLKNPRRYTQIGAEIPKGLLLYGPPGTGKTMLGKATAKEAGVPFYYVSGSQMQGIYVGVGALNIRKLFQTAIKNSPCIIYIDEIDALAAARGSKAGDHKDDFLTITELLTQMDGFEPNNGVVVMAATNKPEVIDPALMRAGRFDRKISVDLPNQKGRLAILEVHGRKIRFDQDVDLTTIASRTHGSSGAELKNILNEAALLAIKEEATKVAQKHILEAIDKVRFGKIIDHEQDDEEIKATAYHEAGHTLVAMMLKDANPVEKVTILPRSKYLGVTITEDSKAQHWKKNLIAEMAVCMGGRVAEEIFFGDLSAGATSDLMQAHRIAKYMTRKMGMTTAGPVSLPMDQEIPHIELIEKQLLIAAEKQAREIIEKNRDLMNLIAEGLLKYETLDKKDLEFILKHRRLPPKGTEN